MSKIIERISREAGVGNLVELLATSLPGSDLQSLLLEVYRHRAETRTAGELLVEHSRNRFAAERACQIFGSELPGWRRDA